MKTLIFSISLWVCGLNSAALAADPYDDLAWAPFHAEVSPGTVFMPHDQSLSTFRAFFHRYPTPHFTDLLKECGSPTDIWRGVDPAQATEPVTPPIPMYYGGHVFRYHLPGNAHLYVWTGEDDQSVMRADYFPGNGPVVPLYLRPL